MALPSHTPTAHNLQSVSHSFNTSLNSGVMKRTSHAGTNSIQQLFDVYALGSSSEVRKKLALRLKTCASAFR
eukprot:825319-Amphidinium_carterae.2